VNRSCVAVGLLTVAWLAQGCAGSPGVQVEERTGRLPAGSVARIGPDAISVEQVALAASVQHATASETVRAQVRDALFAQGARARGLHDTPGTRAALRALLGRGALERIHAEAAATPPTDAELADVTALHFVELDRPEAFRVVHAVVLFPANADAASRSHARAVAERVAKAVASAATADAFRLGAQSVESEGLERRVEELAPVAEDGRVVDVQNPAVRGRLVPEFARAAARLRTPGQKSGIVETPYGYHVLMLLERTPALQVPLDERRTRLKAEMASRRAKTRVDELIGRLRAERPPAVVRSADTLIATLWAEPR
jgi:peptidyl-prolyl cis-trans isomerase C